MASHGAIQASQPGTSTSPSPLLSLPPELRNNIFELLVIYDGPLELKEATHHGDLVLRYSTAAHCVRRAKAASALMSTNKLLRNEIRPVFYGRNNFVLCNDWIRDCPDSIYIASTGTVVRWLGHRTDAETMLLRSFTVSLQDQVWSQPEIRCLWRYIRMLHAACRKLVLPLFFEVETSWYAPTKVGSLGVLVPLVSREVAVSAVTERVTEEQSVQIEEMIRDGDSEGHIKEVNSDFEDLRSDLRALVDAIFDE